MFFRHKSPRQALRQKLQSRVDQRRPSALLKCSRGSFAPDEARRRSSSDLPFRRNVSESSNENPDAANAPTMVSAASIPRFHRRVNALDPLAVKERSRITDDQHTVGVEFRHRPVAARVDRFRAVLDHLAAFREPRRLSDES